MVSTDTELRAKIESLEAELVAAKRLITEELTAKNVQVEHLFPNSMMDRHGAMAIVLAIFVQTAGAIWWASGLSADVRNLQAGANQRDAAMAQVVRLVNDNAERLTRVQTVQETVVKILDAHVLQLQQWQRERERGGGSGGSGGRPRGP